MDVSENKLKVAFLLLVLSSILIFIPQAISDLSNFVTIYSTGSIRYDSPPNDEWVTVFERDYPTGTTRIYGLLPTISSRYVVDVGWDSSGGYLSVGGVRFRVYGTYILGLTTSGTAFSWNVGSNQVTIVIDSDSSLGTAVVTVGSFSDTLSYYDPGYLTDRSALIFTPMVTGTSGTTATRIYHLTQQIDAPTLVTAIGSNKYQAYGYDGPRSRSSVEAGMNEIRAAGMNATIFADVSYIGDPNYLAYLNGLIDDGWEVGIHFTVWGLDTMEWTLAQAEVTSQYNEITQSFGGCPPLSFCLLGIGRFSEQYKNQWVADTFNMFPRMWRVVPQVNTGAHDILDVNIDYWMGAANAGYATIPIYVHETEVEPAEPSSISASLFDTWLSSIITNEVQLTGYNNWYMVNSNQLDASFTRTTSGTDTTITTNTNGYNAIILVKIDADLVTAVTHDGQPISYSTSPEGYLIFEVEDNEDYVVSTGALPPVSGTHTVQMLGPNSYITTYSDNTVTTSTTPYEAIQTNGLSSSKVKQGDTILIKPGNYPLSQPLTGRTGVNLKGEPGTILDVTSLPASSTVLTIKGTKTTTAAPTNTLNKGQITITTATNLGATAGDHIFITSTNIWHNNSAGLKQGEIRTVTAVNGNTLTLEAPLEDTYPQTATTITLINPAQDITIDGITFLNTVNAWDTYPTVQQRALQGIYVEYGLNIRVTNCVFDGIESKAIRFDSVIDSRIDHNRFMKCTRNGAGYGVDIAYACQSVVIEYNEAYNCRHFIVAADTSTLAGVPRHITVQHNYVQDSQYWTGSGWGVQNMYDCHPVGEDIDFLYNEATGKGYGLLYQGYSGSIVGNNFHDLSLYGIGVGLNVVDGVTVYQDEVVVEGNTVTGTTAYGILLGQLPPSVERFATNIRILDNVISGCPVAGVRLFNTRDSVVSGNSIVGCAVGIQLDATTVNVQGSGNGCSVLDDGVGNNVT